MVNVEPGLLSHPKFQAFKRKVGALAAEYLLRLWQHCQLVKKGGNWGKVTPEYVEAVCEYRGKRGKLFDALLNPLDGSEDGVGWVELRPSGDVVVHDWDRVNARLITSWENGKTGGRSKSLSRNLGTEPMGNPRVTDGLPMGNPRVTHGSTYRGDKEDKGDGGDERDTLPSLDQVSELEATIPTVEQMAAELATAAVPYEYLRKRHEYLTENGRWLVKDGLGRVRLINWKRKILSWWLEDQEKRGANKQALEALRKSATREELKEKLENLKAELQCQPAPARRAAIISEIEGIRRMLGL
jgi:uncharacterized lipoprotein NlpE involved in copper resistance